MLISHHAQRARRLAPEATAWARRTSLRRPFTHNPQLLLISRAPARAELPYLHSAALRSRVQQGQGFSQLSFRDRLFTLREVKTWRDFVFTAFQGTLLCWVGWGLYQCVSYGRREDAMESAHPTPPEWSFRSRSALRAALAAEDAVLEGSRPPDWVAVGSQFAAALKRLEDKALEGGLIRGQLGDGEDIYVEGVGRTGLDVSACSEPWRRGYYQTLMGAGRAAERYDSTVRDRASGQLFPADFVVGPSNPEPRPLPPGAKVPAPREENCEPAGPPPETFYLRILTTGGFSTGQRLRAALAYADWLRFKNLNDAAHSMHTWAIDIAVEGAEKGGMDISKLVGRETGVLSSELHNTTPNILLAAESMGSHFALTGNLAAALPAYLSVLRAQQALPTSTPHNASAPPLDSKPQSQGILQDTWHALYPPYPAPPPTGDDPAARSPDTVCASATTMAHIGELLFASDLASLSVDPGKQPSTNSSSWNLFASRSSSGTLHPTRAQAAGLAWTRQAADLAEATLKTLETQAAGRAPSTAARGLLGFGPRRDTQLKERQRRCADCLKVAVGNWAKMVERFERAEREAAAAADKGQPATRKLPADATSAAAKKASAGSSGWGSLLWSERLGLGGEATTAAVDTSASSSSSSAAAAPAGLPRHDSGGWAEEGRLVRARVRTARVLGRQLGLD